MIRNSTRLTRCWKLFVLAWLSLCAAGPAVRADDQDGDGPRLPVVGRPDFFDDEDGPIGSFQTPAVRVEPHEVQVEDPVTMTVRVGAAGRVLRPPRRLSLEKIPGITDQFYIEYPNDPVFRRIDDQTWEFTCTLKPRNTGVQAVPSFPFAFFTPGLVPPERGYQVHRTASIPLVVRPRAAVQTSELKGGIDFQFVPDSILQATAGADAMRRASRWSNEPLLAFGAAGFLLPVLACLGWCFAWRRLHPDATGRARRQRSHAARRALTKLRGLEGNEDSSGRAAAVVASYLRERYALPAADPTPTEVGRHLEKTGLDAGVTRQAISFFGASDAVRYAHLPPSDSLASAARQLVLQLEADTCPVDASC